MPIEPLYLALGAALQRRREALSLTQDEVGRRLVPPQTRASIANIESGKQRVLVHTLVQLAGILECSVTELLPAPVQSVYGGANVVEQELLRKLEPRLGALLASRIAASTRRRAK